MIARGGTQAAEGDSDRAAAGAVRKDVAADADYPAAHSMDTEWFAVDRDGHVARFYSGEEGTVPRGGRFLVPPPGVLNPETGEPFTGEDDPFTVPAAVLCHLGALLPWRSEVAYDPHGQVVPGPRGNPHEAAGPEAAEDEDIAFGPGEGALMCLTSGALIRAELASGQALRVPGPEGVTVLFLRLSPALARELHDAGACVCCCAFHGPFPGEGGRDILDPVHLGLFSYGHFEARDYVLGPYGRHPRYPLRPLHIDELPPALRAYLGQVRLPSVRFAEASHVQPLEHVDCAAYGAANLSADGRRVVWPADKVEQYRHFLKWARERLPVLCEQLQIPDPPR